MRREGEDPLACVRRETEAGTACGSCHAEILEVIADWRGDPVPGEERTQHRLRCESETERLIESSLRLGTPVRAGSGAGAERPVQARVTHLSGLEVTLSLQPDEPWLREAISESLRTLVCGDLLISFSES